MGFLTLVSSMTATSTFRHTWFGVLARITSSNPFGVGFPDHVLANPSRQAEKKFWALLISSELHTGLGRSMAAEMNEELPWFIGSSKNWNLPS